MKVGKSYGKAKKSKKNIMRKKHNELDDKLEKKSGKARRLSMMNGIVRRKSRSL